MAMYFGAFLCGLGLIGLVAPGVLLLRQRTPVLLVLLLGFLLLGYGPDPVDEQPPALLPEAGFAGASVWCPDHVERLAPSSYRWTDGILEPKFVIMLLTDDPNVITYIGDHVEFQNGFGAWQRHIYQCDFDVKTETVITTRAVPGRLPHH